MQFTIYRDVTTQKLRTLLPRQYHAHIVWPVLTSDAHTLIVFRWHRDDVVMSAIVAKALEKLGDAPLDSLIVIAGNFTQEGLALLRQRRAHIYTLSDFYWTDERYQNIRQH